MNIDTIVEEQIMQDTLYKQDKVQNYLVHTVDNIRSRVINESDILMQVELSLAEVALANSLDVGQAIRFLGTKALESNKKAGWFVWLFVGITLGFIMGGSLA